MKRQHLITLIRLARQLGPWADEQQVLPVEQQDIMVERADQTTFPLRLYRNPKRNHQASVFLIPGFHYKGPDHPGIQRLASVFANAGYVVGCPFLDDFMALRLRPSVVEDAVQGFRRFLPYSPHVKPIVMCISFGSLPAFGIASAPDLRTKVGGVVTFGGYLAWRPVMEFCLFHEPLSVSNYPVVFKLLSQIWKNSVDIELVIQSWDKYIHETWELPEENSEPLYRTIANRLAQALAPKEQLLFLQGCGFAEGWKERARQAMQDIDLQWLDNHERVHRLQCPVLAIHGASDSISPPQQSLDLIQELGPNQQGSAYITGLYGHASQAKSSIFNLRAQLAEPVKMLRILHELVTISSSEAH